MKSSLILPGILTVAALLTACGTGSEVTEPSAATASPESVAATTTQDAPATESTVSAVASPAAPAALNAFAPPEGAPELTLQDVRVGTHETYDRVVFEFSGNGLPGYRIQYTDKALQQASGHELAVSGNDILEVLIEGTPMDRLPSNPDLISAGPYQLATGNVAGITNGGTFENQSQFFIGLDRQRSFEATVLESPTRLVIDVHR
ncbi:MULTISPECIES: hypothetical protein [unclassified Corynebacterium]|uniref:AMIN-like domain-containing (lipo)protein n=1 Tax=unclassified Corynebacterium TaxID=2624378 RepID=UPI00210DFFE6|nr:MULTISPECIES: hypothetical protein [unclassified Corynebacterium]MCQ4609014.1 hypothetical protein [Corynebacterium sp. CCUG 61414]MCQ4611107.1 hypothetical protein [Corynebacterium sp. CCUG 51687]MDK8243746.1 hypothetical protein [Corynebacterium sp. UMB10321]